MLLGVFFPFIARIRLDLSSKDASSFAFANLMAKNRAWVSIFPVNVAIQATFTFATVSSLFLWTCVYEGMFENIELGLGSKYISSFACENFMDNNATASSSSRLKKSHS